MVDNIIIMVTIIFLFLFFSDITALVVNVTQPNIFVINPPMPNPQSGGPVYPFLFESTP